MSLFDLSWEKLAENIIKFHLFQLSSQMVPQSLELTTSPWSRDISKLKQSCGNWRNPLCVVFAWKGRRTLFSVVVTAHVSFVQSSLVSAIFARSILRWKYKYFSCVWCHGGFSFFNTIYTIYRYAMKARSMNNHCWVKSVFFHVLQCLRFTSKIHEIRIKAIHIASFLKKNRVKSGHIFIIQNM